MASYSVLFTNHYLRNQKNLIYILLTIVASVVSMLLCRLVAVIFPQPMFREPKA